MVSESERFVSNRPQHDDVGARKNKLGYATWSHCCLIFKIANLPTANDHAPGPHPGNARWTPENHLFFFFFFGAFELLLFFL